jgi:23S rRNA (adenine2503-C2)-methyltransferase
LIDENPLSLFKFFIQAWNFLKKDPFPIKFFELTFSELTSELKNRYGKSAYYSTALFREVYVNGNVDIAKAGAFSRTNGFCRQLLQDLEINLYPVTEIKREEELTKFVTRLKDGLEIESVIIPMATHYTLCVSTQVGCKMGCRFCETARLGFLRNLSVEEIVGQLYTAKFRFGVHVRNVVFMGMGEPLDNYDNVVQAIRVMEDQRGMDIPKRYVSISTSGRIDGIRKLAALNWPQLNLAVSLNASNDQIRSKIMPINNVYPMVKLREALLDFPMKKNGAIYIEYVLIKNLNDRREHARQLADYLKPLKVKVNVIPYNPHTNSFFETPDERDISRFLQWLVEEKIFVRKRSTKGQDILAGCGQLGKNPLSKNQSV